MVFRLLTFSFILLSTELFCASPSFLRVREQCGSKGSGISKSDLLYIIKNDKTFNVNDRDDNGITLLVQCVGGGRVDTVSVLLENGAFVDAISFGWTALFVAAKNNLPAIVWRLLKAGADKNRKDKNGLTPADYANRAGYYEIVEMLGGKPLNLFIDSKRKEAYEILNKAENSEISPSDFLRIFAPYGPLIDEPYSQGGMTILHRSAGESTTELMDAAIKLKANINVVDFPDGNTPLHYAIALENLEAVKKLLEAGADQNIKNSEGATPLVFASEKEQTKSILINFMGQKTLKDKTTQQRIISYLKSYKNPSKWKAKIKEHEKQIDQINQELVAAAVAKAKEENAAKMVKQPVPQPKVPFPKLLDTAGKAIEVNNLSGLIWALDNGLPPDARFPNGNPIILQICFLGNLPMLQALVSRGVNINNRGVDGFTPLMAATRAYKYDVVAYLVKIGADRRLKNNFDWTAMDYARQNRDQRLMFMTKF